MISYAFFLFITIVCCVCDLSSLFLSKDTEKILYIEDQVADTTNVVGESMDTSAVQVQSSQMVPGDIPGDVLDNVDVEAETDALLNDILSNIGEIE